MTLDPKQGEEAQEMEEVYQEHLMDHYRHPRNKRAMDDYTLVHREVNVLCGDDLTVYIKLKQEKIVDVSFTGGGCAISQAAASILTEELKGKEIKEIMALSDTRFLSLLGIPVSIPRQKCAFLCLKAIKGGIHHAGN